MRSLLNKMFFFWSVFLASVMFVVSALVNIWRPQFNLGMLSACQYAIQQLDLANHDMDNEIINVDTAFSSVIKRIADFRDALKERDYISGYDKGRIYTFSLIVSVLEEGAK